MPSFVTSYSRHLLMLRRWMLFFEFTFYASITLSTFESEQLFVMVINAIIASSEMKILVSHLFLSSIFMRGSR